MATLYVSEFKEFATIIATDAPVKAVRLPPIAEQTVAIGGASTASTAFSSITGVIRLSTDTACSIAVGRSPTATTSNMRLAAGQTEYFAVAAGQQIAVIANS